MEPETKPEVSFAASDQVNKHPELKKHFVRNILELPWAFISNETTLSDFHEHTNNDHLLEKIWHVYGVDVSHVKDGNVARILSSIMDEVREFPEDEINKFTRMGRDARNRRVTMLPVPKWIQDEDDAEYRQSGIH